MCGQPLFTLHAVTLWGAVKCLQIAFIFVSLLFILTSEVKSRKRRVRVKLQNQRKWSSFKSSSLPFVSFHVEKLKFLLKSITDAWWWDLEALEHTAWSFESGICKCNRCAKHKYSLIVAVCLKLKYWYWIFFCYYQYIWCNTVEMSITAKERFNVYVCFNL